MERHRVGLPLAIVVAVVAAGAAALAPRPRNGSIRPAPVAAQAYFSPSELERAHSYRRPQRLIGLATLALTGAVVAVIALRPPRRLRRVLERGASRPILAAAGAGAALSLVLVLVSLPLDAVAEQ